MVRAFIDSFVLFYDFSDIFNVFILNKHEYANMLYCRMRQRIIDKCLGSRIRPSLVV